MLEIPEAQTIARQLKETVTEKIISHAVVSASPHGFAWYFGEPVAYGDMLNGKKVTGSARHSLARKNTSEKENEYPFGWRI